MCVMEGTQGGCNVFFVGDALQVWAHTRAAHVSNENLQGNSIDVCLHARPYSSAKLLMQFVTWCFFRTGGLTRLILFCFFLRFIFLSC